MRNVLFITYYFPPIGGAGVQRSAKFVKHLPESGWRPVVLTVAPEDYAHHREFQRDDTLMRDVDGKCDVHCVHDPEPRRLKVMSLTDNVGWITALGNDLGYDQIYVQQLMNYASPGDLAVAISGSGNSPNVLAAVDWANRHRLTTFGVSGFDGGKLKQIEQEGLHVPLDDMAMAESIHLCIAHWVIDDLFARINRQGRYR